MPPLVEPPADDLPPLVSYNQDFFDYSNYPPPGLEYAAEDELGDFQDQTAEDNLSISPPGSSTPIFPEVINPPPSPSKPSHHKKRPADHIPRPPNAFILFRASFIKAQVSQIA